MQGARGSVLLERMQPEGGAAQPPVVVLEDVLDSLWPLVSRVSDSQSDSQSDRSSETADCTASNGILIR